MSSFFCELQQRMQSDEFTKQGLDELNKAGNWTYSVGLEFQFTENYTAETFLNLTGKRARSTFSPCLSPRMSTVGATTKEKPPNGISDLHRETKSSATTSSFVLPSLSPSVEVQNTSLTVTVEAIQMSSEPSINSTVMATPSLQSPVVNMGRSQTGSTSGSTTVRSLSQSTSHEIENLKSSMGQTSLSGHTLVTPKVRRVVLRDRFKRSSKQKPPMELKHLFKSPDPCEEEEKWVPYTKTINANTSTTGKFLLDLHFKDADGGALELVSKAAATVKTLGLDVEELVHSFCEAEHNAKTFIECSRAILKTRESFSSEEFFIAHLQNKDASFSSLKG